MEIWECKYQLERNTFEKNANWLKMHLKIDQNLCLSGGSDAWVGKKTMSINNAQKLAKKFLEKHTPANQYAYNLSKLNTISVISVLKKNKLLKKNI